ncbi:MAG TPA: zf-HC2 domain-containing protein [Terriglobia bacterium]|nr:zf-HC2 domain-containing protein [Terriglobia bacterium]
MFESCVEIREHFSDYLDNLCPPAAQLSIRYHLRYCAGCERELERAQVLQEDLHTLRRRRVPSRADLRLRVRVSQELNRNLLGRLCVNLDNRFRSLLLPATGGLAAAVLFFALMLGSAAVPVNSIPDVPLSFVTPAQVLALAPMDFNTGDRPVVVVTYIDAGGEVMSYKVLSGQRSPELMHNLDRLIYFSRFAPAMTFGKPTDGRVVLSLRRITVRG